MFSAVRRWLPAALGLVLLLAGLVLATGQIAVSKVLVPDASYKRRAEVRPGSRSSALQAGHGRRASRLLQEASRGQAPSGVRKAAERTPACPRDSRGMHRPRLPPSSGESCTFMFPPNQGTFRFSEGPLSSDWLSPRGRVDAVLIFVDFPDAPASMSAGSSRASPCTSPGSTRSLMVASTCR